MRTLVPIENIVDSPFRNKQHNPVKPERVKELMESINITTFWDGVRGRQLPGGKVQIAFGHTRIEAARKAGLTEVPISVEEMTDADMLMAMSRENRDITYGVPFLLEIIEATVKALGDGKLPDFPKLDPKTNHQYVRVAPSFVAGAFVTNLVTDKCYTVNSLAEFLGFTKDGSGTAQNKFVDVVNSLELIERRLIKYSDVVSSNFFELNKLVPAVRTNAARAVALRAKTAEEAAEARKQQLALQEAEKALEEAAKRDNEALLAQRKKMDEAETERKEVEHQAYLATKKANEEAREKRTAEFDAKRAALDFKVEETKQREVAERILDKNLTTRHAVNTFMLKLSNFLEEKALALWIEQDSLVRNDKVTLRERELMYQKMKDVAEKFNWRAEKFAVLPTVDVLEEARKREQSKQKKGKTDDVLSA